MPFLLATFILLATLLISLHLVLHSGLILCQIVTVNVAINSHNKALLTVMVSNQFVELKGSVFKKFDTNNLFQMSCSGESYSWHQHYSENQLLVALHIRQRIACCILWGAVLFCCYGVCFVGVVMYRLKF